jgi:hypothetical protein
MVFIMLLLFLEFRINSLQVMMSYGLELLELSREQTVTNALKEYYYDSTSKPLEC